MSIYLDTNVQSFNIPVFADLLIYKHLIVIIIMMITMTFVMIIVTIMIIHMFLSCPGNTYKCRKMFMLLIMVIS